MYNIEGTEETMYDGTTLLCTMSLKNFFEKKRKSQKMGMEWMEGKKLYVVGGGGCWEKRRGGDGKARVDILAPWGIHALLHNIAYPPPSLTTALVSLPLLSSLVTPTYHYYDPSFPTHIIIYPHSWNIFVLLLSWLFFYYLPVKHVPMSDPCS